VIGPAAKYDPVAERLELLKKEMDKAGLTDEMIRDGYYKKTPFTLGGRPGVLIEGLFRTPAGPVSMHGYAMTQKDGSVQQSTISTNLATGAQGMTTGSRDVDGHVTITRDDRLSGGGNTDTPAPAAAPAASGGEPDDGTTFRSTTFVKDGTTYTDSETRFKDGTTVNTSSSSSDRGTTTETRVTDGKGNEIYHNETRTDSDGNVTKSDSGPSEEDGTPTEGASGADDTSGTPTDDDSGTAVAMTSDDGSAAAVSLRPLGPTKLDQLGHRAGGELGDAPTPEVDDKGRPILRDRPLVVDPSGEPASVDDGTLHIVATAGPEYGPDGRPTVDTSGGPPSNDPYGPISNRP